MRKKGSKRDRKREEGEKGKCGIGERKGRKTSGEERGSEEKEKSEERVMGKGKERD